MIFGLYLFLLALSFLLVIIGLIKTEHTELTVIGFFFIFLLSFTILSNNLEFKTGTTESYTYDCLCCDENRVSNSSLVCDGNSTNLEVTSITVNDVYTPYGSHNIGYWLALASALGLAITFYSLKNTRWKKEL